MSATVLEQLRATLSGAYTIERELGGGGMSRVFVADETALGRKVVVKVVAPELLEGLSRRALHARGPARGAAPAGEHRPAAERRHRGRAALLYDAVRGRAVAPRAPDDWQPRSRSARRRTSCATWPRRSRTRTRRASCTATSSRRTCCCRAARRWSPISGSPRRSRRRARRTAAAMRPTPSSGTLTSVGSSIGTPAYMAPEQAVGSAVDLRADLYAWGVMAYELLTGAHPFAGQADVAEAHRRPHRRNAGADRRRGTPTIPAPLADVVMQCLEKDPAERPASAARAARRARQREHA